MAVFGTGLVRAVETHYSRAESLQRGEGALAGQSRVSAGDPNIGSDPAVEKGWVGLIDLETPQITAWERYFSDRGTTRLAAALKRLEPHRAHVEAILAEMDVPQELVVVAFIESEFVSEAVSSKGATGPWQFMPVTASRYGLRASRQADDRKDFHKSTYAAARYLKDLHELFGDWPLALAAYNAGEERVSDAIRRGKTRDFWVLSERGLLPKETQDYVPKVLGALRVWRELVSPAPSAVTVGSRTPPRSRAAGWVYALTSEESSSEQN